MDSIDRLEWPQIGPWMIARLVVTVPDLLPWRQAIRLRWVLVTAGCNPWYGAGIIKTSSQLSDACSTEDKLRRIYWSSSRSRSAGIPSNLSPKHWVYYWWSAIADTHCSILGKLTRNNHEHNYLGYPSTIVTSNHYAILGRLWSASIICKNISYRLRFDIPR